MKRNIYLFKRPNGTWYILDRTSGKDVWRSTGTTVKVDARRVFVGYRTLHSVPITPAPLPTENKIRLSNVSVNIELRSLRTITDEKVALVVRKTLNTKPKNATQWSVRTLAGQTKGAISFSTVRRIWHAFGLQPHRQRHFKLSSDPFFVEKVRDIVGLYLNPPDKAVVLCVDEKSQIQALDRTQPMLPMGLGYVQGVTHDYERHGTTTLFAALNIASGKVISKCKQRHRHQEYLSFLKPVDQNVPPNLDIHEVVSSVDNYATHKHPKVKRWLATHPRWHVHYTPTSASWLNQVEIWFNIITQRAIRRGTFKSVKDLIRMIEDYVRRYNSHSHPFVWTASADSILEKIKRLCQVISDTGH